MKPLSRRSILSSASLSLALASGATLLVPAVSRRSDDTLMAMIAHRAKLLAECNASQSDLEIDRLSRLITDLDFAIAALPASTHAGLLLKLRIAFAENGEWLDALEGTPPERLVRSAFDDAERILRPGVTS